MFISKIINRWIRDLVVESQFTPHGKKDEFQVKHEIEFWDVEPIKFHYDESIIKFSSKGDLIWGGMVSPKNHVFFKN